MNKLVFAFLGLIIKVALFAQPSWVDAKSRAKSYQTDVYFQSFQMVNIEDATKSDDAIKRLTSDALSSIAQSVFVSVKSNTLSKAVQKNNEIDREFADNTLTESMVELSGVQQEQWLDQKKKTVYVFCFVEKQKLKDFYIGKYKTQISNANTLYNIGEKASKDSNTTLALKNFQLSLSQLKEAANTLTIIWSVDFAFNADDYYLLIEKTRGGLSKIEKTEATDLQSSASLIAHLISLQLQQAQIQVFPFTYQNTQLTGQLSLLLKDQLINTFLTDGKLMPVTIETKDKAKYLLRGSIWEIGDKLRIGCSLQDIDNNKVVAAADVYLQKKWASDNGITWKPDNIDEVLKNMLAMQDISVSGNGIRVEVFTNKGNADLLFTEGETMDIFVKVNHSCYLRMIYVFSDGTQTLLMDNHYIDASLVNRIYKLPEQFECAPPFGVENLKVFASTEKFDALETEELSGYKIIKTKSEDVLKISRGFKVAKNETLKGEGNIVITTMKK